MNMIFKDKQYLLPIILSVLLAAFSVASIVTFTDPETAGWVTFAFLYLSFFLLGVGVLTLVGLTLRSFFSKGVYLTNLQHSFRQAVLVSLFLVATLALSAAGLLFWWVGVSLGLVFVFVELFLNLKV